MRKITSFLKLIKETAFTKIILGVLLIGTLYASSALAQMPLNTAFNAGVTDGNSQGFVTAFQPDGKILVGGSYTFVNGTEQASLTRLNTNGTTDTTFNTGGLGPNGVVYEIKILGDGKIIIGGGFTTYNGSALSGLARLNANGTLDTTFNPGGGGTVGTIQGIFIQTDGKYLISGSNLSSYNATARFSVIRVNTDGTLDTTFTSPFTTAQFVEQTGTQSDGKVVIGGIFTISGYSNIARLNTTGTLDTTFNVGGTGPNAGVFGVFVLADNRILIGGDFTSYNGTARPSGARLTSTGALDATFNPPTIDFAGSEYIVVKPNGQYLIAGAYVDIDGGFPIALLNTDGSVDATFNPPQADNRGYHVTLQPDGKILLAGWFNNVEVLGGLTHRNLVRLNANGTVDSSFNCAFNAFGSTTAMLQQTDGKYVIGGNFNAANGVNHTNVTRFNSDGTIDNSFQSGFGLFSTGFVQANVLAQQTDGRLLLGGIFYQYNLNDARSLVRLNSDGSMDPAFNPIGISAGSPSINDLLIQPDGKIIVAGSGLDIGFQTLVRLNTNGTGDSSFVPGNGNGNMQKVLRQADGKLIVVGNFTSYLGQARSRIVRLNTDGTLDSTFNIGTGTNNQISTAAFQADGKLLIGGFFTSYNGTTRNRIARLNSDGTLDASFNPPSGANGSVGAMVIQPDGKIVISGGFTTYDGVGRVRLARINANGTLDSSADSGVVNNFRFGIRRLLLTADNELLVGGIFTTYSGTPRNSLAKLKLAPTGKAPFDFDGDGKTDVSIFRPSVGEWWYQRSSDLGVRAGQFGVATDKITPGDYTGDGRTDIAFWRPSSGEWFILRSEDGSFFSFPFGANGDVPVPADYDGDGRYDAAVFRPSTSTWFILNSGGGGTGIVNFGTGGDKPVAADYDGDGKADIAIFRPSDGSWWYLRSSDSQFRVFTFGVSTDQPVQGDFTGDGKADIAVWRPSTGFWFIQRSEDNSFYSVPFGTTGDVPVPGDYDGDGRQDTAVFRPTGATWFANRSTAGILIQNFGLSTDTAVPSAYVP